MFAGYTVRVRQNDGKNYWQFRSADEIWQWSAGKYLKDDAYICELNDDGSEGPRIGSCAMNGGCQLDAVSTDLAV